MFSNYYKPTITLDFCHKNIRYKGNHYLFQLWDNSSFNHSYFSQSNGILLLIDLTNNKSINNLRKQIETIVKYSKKKKPFIYLIGTKSDLIQQRR